MLRFRATVLAISLLCALAATFAWARSAIADGLIEAVDPITITVSDMERALDFYEDVLTFEKVSDVEAAGEAYQRSRACSACAYGVARLRLGDEHIELMEVMSPQGRPIPADSRSNDIWFQHVAIIVSDMKRAFDWLRAHDITFASPAPQRLPDWNPNAGGIPGGNHLEVLEFPQGKGDPKWHEPSDRLFLGIDHTAIVVEDTDASLAFWRDLLGLQVAGESENWGPEQERLNNVFGAHLRITALRAPVGPGIELLEYLTPRDGRPFPADTRASDLWHWQINLRAANVERAAEALRSRRALFVSSGVTALPDDGLGFEEGVVMARDPDGHALLLMTRRWRAS